MVKENNKIQIDQKNDEIYMPSRYTNSNVVGTFHNEKGFAKQQLSPAIMISN